jgi:response regulator NasT
MLSATAATAVERAADLAALQKQVDDLRDTLETRKIVERAKGVLMRRLSVSEEDAYRKMQRASQDENRKMRDIAESILSAERLYGAAVAPQAISD